MTIRVAVVAMACEFPEGRSPEELWDTVLHGRRCFRPIPAERLLTSDYPDHGADGIYPIEAGLLEGYQFDRARFRVPQSAFDRTDMAHWLALDVASRALQCLSPDSVRAECDNIAVIVANTLTGEFSRAHALRYRWPYVARAVRAAAEAALPADADVAALLAAAERHFKAPLAAPDEDSLAGALSNTIAGRIANHHGLRGGAHTVDGACASSLVAVTSACDRLAAGDVGCVLVGAVDLSLDPFELVGFARNGALAHSLMRVFDEGADGFWPGEGCGFLMLATEALVERHQWPVLGWIRGSAMSTDGAGALTRPSADGQTLAARRAWAAAGLRPAAADYFEAHGTGTPTGDPIELEGLAGLLAAESPAQPVPVGSVKANFGHTKAAAGMAGMLKALMICRERIIPPTTGCDRPHALLQGPIGAKLGVRQQARAIAHERPLTVGVNSFGFGGINCHVVLEGAAGISSPARSNVHWPNESALPGELFQLSAASAEALAEILLQLGRRAATLTRAQLADLASALDPGDTVAWRACVLAATPGELAVNASAAAASVATADENTRVIGERFSWCAPVPHGPRIACLLSGQGSLLELEPSRWAARFAWLAEHACRADALRQQDQMDTAVAQALLAEIALAGIDTLARIGIEPHVVMGHSFGELPALHCAGRMTRAELRELARWRGACMRDHAGAGKMVAIRAAREEACALAARHGVELACENGASRFVLSGEPDAIDAALADADASGFAPVLLSSSRSFHSHAMAPAHAAFAPHASQVDWTPASREFVSSITGRAMLPHEDVAGLLAAQLVRPVLFAQALEALGEPDLVIELGSGAVLKGLAEERFPGRALTIDLFGTSPLPLLSAMGAAWVCGAKLKRAELYQGRSLRPCSIDGALGFLASPCGVSPGAAALAALPVMPLAAAPAPLPPSPLEAAGASALGTLKAVIAELTGLPLESLHDQLRLLSDLHLNSIRARHAVAQCAQRLGIASLPFALARLSNARIEEAAAHLEALRGDFAPEDGVIEGVAPWLRMHTHCWAPVTLPPPEPAPPWACVLRDPQGLLDQEGRYMLDVGAAQPVCIVVVLPRERNAAACDLLLDAVHQLTADASLGGILVLQGAHMANAFLRSAAFELPERRFCVVEYVRADAACLAAAMAEYRTSANGYSELRMRATGGERRVLAALQPQRQAEPWSMTPAAVLIVTGGASGIGAASAAAMAHAFGCRLALIGRSPPQQGSVLTALTELRAQGCDARYFQADLACTEQAAGAVAAIASEMGPARAVLHAAGINRPVGVAMLGRAELAATVASKVDTLRNLLDCLPAAQLELIVAYGSIIGELGLAGEAHYALANEWLGQLMAQVALDRPACKTHLMAWGAWREVGMAARMEGVLDRLAQQDSRAIGTAEGTAMLVRLVRDEGPPAPVCCGRFGRPVSGADQRAVQALRFMERLMVFYPGVELIAEATLCSDSDPYLLDHAPHGVILFPMACAMEAMLSAAAALADEAELPLMLDFSVGEGISLAVGQRVTLRTCALRHEDGTVQVQLRAETTGFELAHFSAVFSWRAERPAPGTVSAGNDAPADAGELLYRGICFHGPGFQQLGTVLALSAAACRVTTGGKPAGQLYGPFLPKGEAGGSPPLRDSVMHALQLCVPHQLVLPVGVAAVSLGRLDPRQTYQIAARQRFSDGERYVFDIDVFDDAGTAVECWRSLELKNATPHHASPRRLPLAPLLLESLAGRLAMDVLGISALSVRLHSGLPRHAATATARARGQAAPPANLSATHFDQYTLVVASASERVALDVQCAAGYALDEWRLMLGNARWQFAEWIAQAYGFELAEAALCTWSLSECLIKLGIDGWPLRTAGGARRATAAIGDVLSFDCGQARCLVALCQLRGKDGPAALAMAHAPRPADAAAPEAVVEMEEGS
jgi:enediyne polyketide synthase